MKHWLAIQHLAFEDLGNIAPVLVRAEIGHRYIEEWSPKLIHIDPDAPGSMASWRGCAAV